MAFITSDSSGKRIVVPTLANTDYTDGVTFIKNNHGVIAVPKGKESEYTYTIGSAGFYATPKYSGIEDDNNNVAVEMNSEPVSPSLSPSPTPQSQPKYKYGLSGNDSLIGGVEQ